MSHIIIASNIETEINGSLICKKRHYVFCYIELVDRPGAHRGLLVKQRSQGVQDRAGRTSDEQGHQITSEGHWESSTK